MVRIRSRVALLPVITLLCAAALLAAPVSPAHAAGETVSGIVTDAVTGLPLAGVDVHLYRRLWKTDSVDGRGYWSYVSYGNVTTLANGTYRQPDLAAPLFESLPAGEYQIVARNDGYADEYYDNINAYGAFTFGVPATFQVTTGAQVSGIDVALDLEGDLDVRLTDPSGQPLDDATVDLYAWDAAQRVWWQLTGFNTDANGRVPTVFGAPGATYRVTFHDPHHRFGDSAYGGGVLAAEGADVVITPGRITKLSAVLGPPSYATGRVLNSAGMGLCDIQVTAFRYDPYYDQWAWASSDLTDAAGRYALVQTAGVYRYEFRDSAGTLLNSSDDATSWYPGVPEVSLASDVTLVSGGTRVLADMVLESAGGVASRVAGLDRYRTAVAASRQAFADGTCETVVLASGSAFPDALSASALVGASEGSLLLTKAQVLPSAVADEIVRLGASDVIVIGGPAAIGDAVLTQLKNLGLEVRRVYGRDRYATSAAVAREVDELVGHPAAELVIARGDTFADAVAASGIGSGLSAPVLLTRPSVLPFSVRGYLEDTLPQTAVLLGGTSAIAPGVEMAIGNITGDVVGSQVVRVYGANRYATAANFASWCLSRHWIDGTHIGVASGLSFADALSAGAAVGRSNGCVLLTRSTELSPEPRAFIRAHRNGMSSAIVYGGPLAVRPATLFEIGAAIDQQ